MFKIVFAMLDDMKANGVYDNSNIFIIADHGAKRNLGNGVYGMCQFAACLYKPAGSTGAFTTNDAPVSLLDVTATLDAIAGGDYSQVGSGRTVYEIQEDVYKRQIINYLFLPSSVSSILANDVVGRAVRPDSTISPTL